VGLCQPNRRLLCDSMAVQKQLLFNMACARLADTQVGSEGVGSESLDAWGGREGGREVHLLLGTITRQHHLRQPGTCVAGCQTSRL
jgi:hypothetical protein